MKPLRISWSALRTHEECKQKSFLLRQGKRSKVTNIRNFFAGLVVDNIMRDWLDTPVLRTTPIGDVVSAAMDEMENTERGKGNMVRWRDAQDRAAIRDFCVTLIERLGPILEEYVLPYPYAHGQWFKVPMNLQAPDGSYREVMLTGEMDLIVHTDDGPIIWDLKGTADSQYWRKVVGQLVFYDLATWASSGTKTRGVGLIQPMCPEQILAWEVTDEARRQLLARIQRYATDVWTGENTCTDNVATCHWCDTRHACPRYTKSGDVFGDFTAGLRAAAGENT